VSTNNSKNNKTVVAETPNKGRGRNLTAYELETIINFNKGSPDAEIFTYEKTWQKHLEQRLGLKPTMDNGYGGKGYKLPKSLIHLPRAKMKVSEKRLASLNKALMVARQKRLGAVET
jgi:hypothetical protein